MRIEQIDIKNFRSIDSLTIDCDPRCQVLVGINETGKTNVLRALSLLDAKKKYSPEDWREPIENEPPINESYVGFIMTFSKNDISTIVQGMHQKFCCPDIKTQTIFKTKNKKFTLEEYIGSCIKIHYSIDLINNSRNFSLCCNIDQKNLQTVNEVKILETPNQTNNNINTTDDKVFSTKTVKFFINSYITPETLQQITYHDATPQEIHEIVEQEIRTQLNSANSITNIIPKCIFWTYSEDNLLPNKIPLENFKNNPNTSIMLKHMFELYTQDSIKTIITDAQQTEKGLKNLLDKVAKKATKHIKSIWKEADKNLNISLEVDGGNIDASIKDKHNYYSLKNRSDGFKRFVTLLFLISAPQRTNTLSDTLILLDEPDTSLHPTGAKYLRDELIKLSENNFIMYSTHSIFMIDNKKIERHLLVSKNNEKTSVEKASSSNITDEEVVFKAIGYSVFEHLKPCNIIFEGYRDKKLFQTAINSKKISTKLKNTFSKIGLTHAQGAKDIKHVSSMLELAKRSHIMISDNDKPAQEKQKLYDGPETWYRYNEICSTTYAITAEDFVTIQAFNKALTTTRKQYSQVPTLTPDQIPENNRIEQIKSKLSKSKSIDGQMLKTILNQLKDNIFNNLKPNDITEEYFTFLTSLATILDNKQSNLELP